MKKKETRTKTIITLLVAFAAIGLMAGLFAVQHSSLSGENAKAAPAASDPQTADSAAAGNHDPAARIDGNTKTDGAAGGKTAGSGDPYARAKQVLKDYPDEKYDGFIVQLNENASAKDAADVDRAIEQGAKLTKLQYTENTYTAASLDEIRACVDDSLISCIQPNYQKYMMEGEMEQQSAEDPDDPDYSLQFNLRNLSVPAVWAYGFDGRDQDSTVDMDHNGNAEDDDIIIAVIDSGLIDDHEDIDKNRVLKGQNFASDGLPDDTDDENGHGTFVSGIIAAKSDNGKGIAGILQGVKIMPLRIFGSRGTTSSDIFLEALNYASSQKELFRRTDGREGVNISVINMSLGGDVPSAIEKEACERAIRAGIILVSSAGNDYDDKGQKPSYPAQYCMGVGSVNSVNNVSDFSQRLSGHDGEGYANKLWVTAPGQSIRSLSTAGTHSYRYNSGTSFSCPEVAALAALCKSLDNGMNQSGFMDLVKETAERKDGSLGNIYGQDREYGWGLANFEKTINAMLDSQQIQLGQQSMVTVNVRNGAGSVIPSAQTVIQEKTSGDSGSAIAPDEPGGSVWTLQRGKTYTYRITADGYDPEEGHFTLRTEKRVLAVTLTNKNRYPVTIRVVDVHGEDTAYDSMTMKASDDEQFNPASERTYKLPNGKYKCTVKAPDALETIQTIVVDDVKENLTNGKTETVTLRKDRVQLEVARNGSLVFRKAVALVSMLNYTTGDALHVTVPGQGRLTARVYGIKLKTVFSEFGPAPECIRQVTVRGKRPVQADAQSSISEEPNDGEGEEENDLLMEDAVVILNGSELNRAMIALIEDPVIDDNTLMSQGNYMRLAIDNRPESDWLYAPERISADTRSHQWNGGRVTRTATASVVGVKTYTCTVCGAERKESIPMLDPGAVSGMRTAGNYNNRQIRLSFNRADGATDYVVRWRQNGGSWRSMWTGGGTSAWITGLGSGAMIDLQVRAYRASDGRYGPWSETSRCLMSTVNLKNVSGGKKKVTVKWKKTAGVTAYRIYYSTRSDMRGAAVKSIGKKKTSCIINRLKKKTRYYIVVQPVRWSGTDYTGIQSGARSAKTKK